MTKPIISKPYLHAFKQNTEAFPLPLHFTNPFHKKPHPIALLAAKELQDYLIHQTEWNHNFGLNSEKEKSTIIGKMFGVLVVQNSENKLGYLAAFSGKLAETNSHKHFVPPVFDSLTKNSFLTEGMKKLSEINQELKNLEAKGFLKDSLEIKTIKTKRKNHSKNLQEKLFEQYHFLNFKGEETSLVTLFKNTPQKKPSSGAGECAAPKLLNYAFKHHLKPVAIAEFWWGMSPKSTFWKHQEFYPACEEKCRPILNYMLEGLKI